MSNTKVYTTEALVPLQCEDCVRKTSHMSCTAYTSFMTDQCHSKTSDYKKVLDELEAMIEYNEDRGNTCTVQKMKSERKKMKAKWDKEINKCYQEDKHRGAGGGSKNEGGGRQIKALMNDNRDGETKELTQRERKPYKEALDKFEEEHGALDKLKPDDGMTRSKVDSYTGEAISEYKKPKKSKTASATKVRTPKKAKGVKK